MIRINFYPKRNNFFFVQKENMYSELFGSQLKQNSRVNFFLLSCPIETIKISFSLKSNFIISEN